MAIPADESKIVAADVRVGSAPNQPIERNSGEAADGNEDDVEVGELVALIDERDQHERGKAAGNRSRGYLSRKPARAPGAAVRVG